MTDTAFEENLLAAIRSAREEMDAKLAAAKAEFRLELHEQVAPMRRRIETLEAVISCKRR